MAFSGKASRGVLAGAVGAIDLRALAVSLDQAHDAMARSHAAGSIALTVLFRV